MTKRRTILVVLMSVLMTLLLAVAAACGGGGEKVALKWDIADHATVQVEGYDALPEEVKAGTELRFTVTPDNGYEVTVNVGRNRLSAKNGVYTYTVNGEVTITVTVNRIVSDVVVSQKPTKNLYYAGEEIDRTGMVVTVQYATGENETTDVYTVNYQTKNATAFTLGDTYYTVTFGAKESAHVELDQAVVGRIVVDPAGGEIESAYKSQLEAMPGIKDITVDDESGIYTFYFEKALTESIPLPINAQLSRGEEFQLVGMQENGTRVYNVPAETAVSHTYTAAWVGELVKLTSVKYEKETVSNKEVPFLVFRGTFNAADEVQLVLYEGNAKVTFEGESVKGTKGDEFVLKLNMVELAEAQNGACIGKWMDITFVAKTVVGGNTITDRQEIFAASYEEGVIDRTAMNVGGVNCTFEEYNGALKAVVNLASTSEGVTATIAMTMTAAMEKDVPTLTFSGTINAEHNGKTVTIDYEIGSTTYPTDATVADGTFEIKIDLTKIPLNSIAYFHLYLKDNGLVVYKGDENGNLLNSWCISDAFADHGRHALSGNDYLLGADGNEAKTIELANEDKTSVYYIGYGKWGGIIAYGENQALSYTEISAEEKEGTPYYVISGSYNEALAADKLAAILKAEWENGDISNNPDAGSMNADWTVNALSAEGAMTVEPDETAHTFKLFIALPKGAAHGWILFLHIAANNNFMGTECTIGDPIMIGNIEYAIRRGEGYSDTKSWINNLPMLYITDTAKTQLSVASGSRVRLYVDDFTAPTKVYYIVNVNHKNAELANIYFGNADGGEYYGADATLSKLNEDGTGELWFDITAYNGTQLWPHLYYKETDGSYTHFVEIKDTDSSVGTQYAVVGGRVYSLKNDSSVYNDVCLVTAEAEEGMKNPPKSDKDYTASTVNGNSLKIEVVDQKVLITVEGTAITKYYTKDDVKLYLYNVGALTRMPVEQEIDMKEDGSFTIKADITGLEVSVVTYSVRVYFGTFEDHYVIPKAADNVNLDFGTKVYTVTRPGNTATTISVSEFKGYKATAVAFDTTDETKIKFVVSGIYQNATKEAVEEKLGETLEFDFALNDHLAHTGWATAEGVTKESFEVTEDGTWQVVFDITSLTDAAYTVHFDGGDLKITDDSLDGLTAQFSGKTFKVSNKVGSAKGREFWGTVGILIVDPARTYADYDPEAITIKEEGGKPMLVISGTYTGNVTQDMFDLDAQENNAWTPNALKDYLTVTLDNGKFEAKADISSVPASKNDYILHFFVGKDDSALFNEGNVVGDIPTGTSLGTWKIGEKQYSLEVRHMWESQRVQLYVEDAETNTGIRVRGVDVATNDAETVAYYVVTVSSLYSEQDLQSKLKYGDSAANGYSVAKIEAVTGGYTVYFDVTSAPGNGAWIWSKLFYDGAAFDGSNGDIKFGANGKSVTVGSKTYRIQNIDGTAETDGNTWGIDVLVVEGN